MRCFEIIFKEITSLSPTYNYKLTFRTNHIIINSKKFASIFKCSMILAHLSFNKSIILQWNCIFLASYIVLLYKQSYSNFTCFLATVFVFLIALAHEIVKRNIYIYVCIKVAYLIYKERILLTNIVSNWLTCKAPAAGRACKDYEENNEYEHQNAHNDTDDRSSVQINTCKSWRKNVSLYYSSSWVEQF